MKKMTQHDYEPTERFEPLKDDELPYTESGNKHLCESNGGIWVRSFRRRDGTKVYGYCKGLSHISREYIYTNTPGFR